MNTDGYTKCPNDLLRNPDISPVEKIVWLFISSNLPGYAYSAKEACTILGISRPTWINAVNSLLEKGMITASLSGGKGIKNSYSAVLNVSRWTLSKNFTTLSKNLTNENVKNFDKVVKKSDKVCQEILQSTPYNREKTILKDYICLQKRTLARADTDEVEGGRGTFENEKSEVLVTDQKDRSATEAEEGARAMEKFRGEVYNSTIKMQQIMKANAIYDTAEFYTIAEAILCEWEAADTPAHEINWRHFVHVFRIKANEKRKANGTNQPKTREQQLAELQQGAERIVARAIAESAANMRQVQNPS